MTAIRADDPSAALEIRASSARRLLRETAFGFLFWLGFVLVLEPGNLIRAARAGQELSWSSEALRMVCAALLGAPSCPLLLWLAGRLAVRGTQSLRNAALLFGCIAALAAGLILIASALAPRLPPSSVRGGLGEQIVGNVLLLMAAMAVLVTGAQLAARARERQDRDRAAAEPRLERIPVKGRGRTVLVDVGEIDWIEAQGNYLALHVGPAAHLIRETLAGLEARLDEARFVRIHRGAMVNVARVHRVRPLGNGDAMVGLKDGAELRVSRKYRLGLEARLTTGPLKTGPLKTGPLSDGPDRR